MIDKVLVSNEEYSVHFQPNRRTYVKIDLLDFKTEMKIESLEGIAIEGNINLRNESIRRSGCIKIKLNNNTNTNASYWFNRKIRLALGILNTIDDKIIWFEKGKFIVCNPNINYSLSEQSITLEILDYMALLDGKLNGQLGHKLVIPPDMPIHEAVRLIIEDVFPNYLIESTDFKTPMEIKKNPVDTKWEVVKTLRDLYFMFEAYVNINGFFVYQPVQKYSSDPVVWDFTGNKLVVSYSKQDNSENVKNHILVLGKEKEDGTQIKYETKNINPNNPYNFNNCPRLLVVEDNKIFTDEMAKGRGDYELFIHSNCAEKVTISCLPIYVNRFDVNKLIYLDDETMGVKGKYLIDSIDYSFKFDGLMNVSCHKVYE